MVFSSAIFLFAFLPLYFIAVSLVRSSRICNVLLLIMSLVFYAWGEPIYILLMLFSISVNYVLALCIGSSTESSVIKQSMLILDVVFNLTLLVLFKYAGFIVTTVNSLLGLSIDVPQIPLPIGISFFTFQTMSYVIDAYRGNCRVQKNFAKFALYVSFFPQLIAGPIVKYHDIESQLNDRKVNLNDISDGFRRFTIGLSKKMLLANVCAGMTDTIYDMAPDDLNIFLAWTAAICYCLQIYLDFSGYSDMAIGLGRMAGFVFPENFNYPYIAVSIRDFWKRWHISLTSWFREYVYFPLGGNRKGMLRTGFNRMTVFLLTGLWHGAQWTFVVWGAFHGILMLLETYLIHPEKWKKIVGRAYTLLTVTLGFVIFRADSMNQAFDMISSMFTGFKFTETGLSELLKMSSLYGIFIVVAASAACTPLFKRIGTRIGKKNPMAAGVLKYSASVVLFLLCIMSLASGSYDPFIYFRF